MRYDGINVMRKFLIGMEVMVYKIKNNGLCNVINVNFYAATAATPPEHIRTTYKMNLLVQMTETHMCCARENVDSLISHDVWCEQMPYQIIYFICEINVAVNVYFIVSHVHSYRNLVNSAWKESLSNETTILKRYGIFKKYFRWNSSDRFYEFQWRTILDYLEMRLLTICAHGNHIVFGAIVWFFGART